MHVCVCALSQFWCLISCLWQFWSHKLENTKSKKWPKNLQPHNRGSHPKPYTPTQRPRAYSVGGNTHCGFLTMCRSLSWAPQVGKRGIRQMPALEELLSNQKDKAPAQTLTLQGRERSAPREWYPQNKYLQGTERRKGTTWLIHCVTLSKLLCISFIIRSFNKYFLSACCLSPRLCAWHCDFFFKISFIIYLFI